MCLAVPGRIESIQDGPGGPIAEVDFAGVRRNISLACTPEARIGDYVLVHVGFAISVVDEEEARGTLDLLREMGELGETEAPR